MTDKASYGQILKSSSIMGGAAGINLLLGMVRTKFAAVLIGTTGVGLLAGFGAVQGLVGTVAGLGIQSSAVREVAAALAKNDKQSIGRTVLTLRRICWLTGLAGMLTMVMFSRLISQLTFGSTEYTLDIAALGIIILFANLTGGQMALIQGMRRIGDMARANVLGALFGTISALGFYSWLGLRGIVPSLVAVAAMQLAISWYFSRRIPVPAVDLDWRQTFAEAGGMVRLGIVFMWTGLMGAAVAYVTVMLITKYAGLQSVGIYSASFALSGVLTNFVLRAMGADYYPRLTGLTHDTTAMNQLVNEQTEIALLLALPGLLATLVFAPWIIEIFYTKEFLPAIDLMRWFVLGCFGQVVSWPLGFVMLALGKSKWYFLTETSFSLVHVTLVAACLLAFGLEGVAVAFPLMYVGYTLAVFAVANHLTGFRWSAPPTRLLFICVIILLTTFAVCKLVPFWPAMAVGFVIIIITSGFCLRGLVSRLGGQHRITRVLSKIPGVKMAFGL